MKKITFSAGLILLILTLYEAPLWGIKNSTIILFICIILIAFFDELSEFNLLGILKGTKTQRKLKELSKTVDKSEQATSPSQAQEDNLTLLRKKTINLMSVDRGNLLALIFEIERLLRLIAISFYPDIVNEKTSLRKIIELLKKKEYLTENGVNQLNALNEVRNLIVHGQVPNEEDSKLIEWVEIAYHLYKEIYSDIYGIGKHQVKEGGE